MKNIVINIESFHSNASYIGKELMARLKRRGIDPLLIGREKDRDILCLMKRLDFAKHQFYDGNRTIIIPNYTNDAVPLMKEYGEIYFDYPLPDINIFVKDTLEESRINKRISKLESLYKQLGEEFVCEVRETVSTNNIFGVSEGTLNHLGKLVSARMLVK